MRNQGWFGESFRHSLASKGIPSKYYARKRYFVLNELKGNRDSGGIKRAYALGWSKDELRRDPSARAAFGVGLAELQSRRSSFQYPESPSRAEESVALTSELPLAPVVEESAVGGDGGGAPEFSTENIDTLGVTTENTVTTEPPAFSSEPVIASPGVPSEPLSAQGSVAAPFKSKESTGWRSYNADKKDYDLIRREAIEMRATMNETGIKYPGSEREQNIGALEAVEDALGYEKAIKVGLNDVQRRDLLNEMDLMFMKVNK